MPISLVLQAFVLINTEMGMEDSVADALRKVDGIKEVYKSSGVYDIIAKVEAHTAERFKEVVNRKLRNYKEIKSTITMMVANSTN
jgi:DNA-binding Lrp family transcriptional regulator